MAAGGTITREVLTRPQRTKLDGTSDRQFYAFPRIVKHVDDSFLAQVTQLYRQRIPPGAAVLDLMSSWVSHLPQGVKYDKVVGHGMNPAELAKNKQLDSFFVRDLNAEPDGWALADSSFDAVTCCVSVQYLQQPERVFAEIYRVLRPGGVCIITFSNRMFYDKAITAWRDGTGFSRCNLVKQYFQCVEGFTEPEVLQEVKLPEGSQQGGLQGLLAALPQPLQQFMSRAGQDPFYGVVAYRNFKPEHQ
jgi:SAM-dependent methyltransferase